MLSSSIDVTSILTSLSLTIALALAFNSSGIELDLYNSSDCEKPAITKKRNIAEEIYFIQGID